MISYGQFQFANPPRCGTAWFLKACELVGLGRRYKAEVHKPFGDNRCTIAKLSLIRHPCDWLLSYYTIINPGKIDVVSVDTLSNSNADFDSYIRWYLNERPCGVSKMFESYQAEMVIKLEDLPWAAIDFLNSFGIDAKQIATLAPLVNRGKKIKRAEWNPSLRERVIDMEFDFLERYDYV